jgi:hypothetical protein
MVVQFDDRQGQHGAQADGKGRLARATTAEDHDPSHITAA